MFIFEAFREWSDNIRPEIEKQYSASDAPALNESWSNYTDALEDDGEFCAMSARYAPHYASDDMPADLSDEIQYLINDALGVYFNCRLIKEHPFPILCPGGHSVFHVTIARGSCAFSFYMPARDAYEPSRFDWEPASVDMLDYVTSFALTFFNSENFEDWAEGFGFDEDSRRAVKAYEHCEFLCMQLFKMFSEEEISDLRHYLDA